jgi:hypothetical protein
LEEEEEAAVGIHQLTLAVTGCSFSRPFLAAMGVTEEGPVAVIG